MLYLLSEPEYKKYPWYQRTMAGLNDESMKKRISLVPVNTIAEITDQDADSAILLLGASHSWISRWVDAAVSRRIHPIVLTSRFFPMMEQTFSSVSINMGETVRHTMSYLRSLGREKIALFGVNPDAVSDPFYAEAFCRLTGRTKDVYYLENTLTDTFRLLRQHLAEYNAVVCVNDYAAILLLHELQQMGVPRTEMPYIVGYGDLNLCSVISPSITTISDNYEAFGRAAFSIYNMVIREKMVASVNISINSQLIIRETTGNQPFLSPMPDAARISEPTQNRFFRDVTIAQIVSLEKLFQQADETDRIILDLLAQNATYPDIAEQCYISETTVKYRVKKMKSILGVHSRAELMACIGLVAFRRLPSKPEPPI